MISPTALTDSAERTFQWKVWIALTVAWIALLHFFGNAANGYVETHSLFAWWWALWNGNPDDGAGMLVPLLVAYVVWSQKKELLLLPSKPSVVGLIILIFSLIAHYLGFGIQQTRISAWACVIGCWGIAGLVWGTHWLRHLFLPMILLCLAVPLASLLDQVTFPLRLLVTAVAVGFSSSILNLGVVRDGTLIFDRSHTYQYDVAPACSGINSLMAMVLLSVAFAILRESSAWRRWVIIAVAPIFAVLGNIVRLIVVIIVAEVYGRDSGKAIETNLGFLTFATGLVGMYSVSVLLRWRERSSLELETDEYEIAPRSKA